MTLMHTLVVPAFLERKSTETSASYISVSRAMTDDLSEIAKVMLPEALLGGHYMRVK